MALKVRQKKVCVDMLLYQAIQQIDDSGLILFDEDEREVIEAMKEFADERIAKYPVVPDGGLHEIVAYVKEHY